MSHRRLSAFGIGALLLLAPARTPAQSLDSATLAGFRWRTVGPANFEGRVADLAGIPSPSKTFFVAAAAGGIWKTTNNGTTFRPVFDASPCISMGALAIAPSDTQQVWAGTGEQNSRNTIEPGCGIFKSTDGGVTWKSMGLEKTQHIGRIIVHPTNPNIVYVAALGAAWKNSAERGLYKTTDGGQSWQLVKFVSDRAGFIDVAMDPRDPNVLYASSYERIRGPYFLRSGGPGSALWKTTDGGATWTEIKGGGFPETMKGRINVAIAMSNPDVVYASVEADSIRGRASAPGQTKQKLANGLYRSSDAGKTWTKMNDANTRPFYYSQVRVHPKNPDRVWFSSTPVLVSNDGGKTARTATVGIHVDHHAMWIDPNDPDRMVVGDDGGISLTFDGGGNWDFPANLPIGQFYEVSYDFEVPYNICGGAQDNGSWCGPSRRKQGTLTNAYWFTFAGGDGFYTAQHPTEPWVIFGESQGGNISRVNTRTGERTSLVKPTWRPRYQQFEDSVLVTRGDTTQAVSRDVERRIADLRGRQRSDSAEFDLRFNWNTPFFISPHNPDVMYVGGNKVLKSTQRGDNLYPISPDLSKKQMAKIDTSMRKTGGITLDATSAETYGTVVVLAESYVRPGFLWAGTDDGNVWFTRSDGALWEPIPTTRFPGLPTGDVYVTRVEPSHFDSLTAYVAFDNHRWNDFAPYLYVTTDGGRTFRSISANLPTGGVDNIRAFREDPVNRDLLYVGTAIGVYVSLDRGTTWQRFMSGLPVVPVYDLKIHPRDHELIAATHGRSFWIVDVAPLQQMNRTIAAKPVHLFEPKTAYDYGQGLAMGESSNGAGQKGFVAPNPPYGGDIVYRLASATRDTVRVIITDARGDTVRTLNGPNRAGVHHVTWDLRGRPARVTLSPSQRRDSLAQARRLDFVIDSLTKAGTVPAPVLERLRSLATNPAGFFGGGGGGGGGGNPAQLTARLGPGGVWNARPGEGNIVGAGGRASGGGGGAGGGGGGGGGGGAQGGEGGGDPQEIANAFPGGFEEIRELLRVPGARTQADLFGGGGGGAGRNRGGSTVQTGDYVVTLKVGNETQRQVLRVERVNESTTSIISNDDMKP
ncbi:MAG TPA: hypothetical protein VKH19_10445 [Gemmatimonadaceae bacterium]|nr:hypothetical protein [Gemmatimonadaceae bacterium]